MKGCLSQDPNTSEALQVNRRDALKLLGSGIIIFLYPPQFLYAQQARGYNAFLRIGEDGTVTIFTGKIEMGQGVMTSLGQMAAEELDVPTQSIRMVMGDTDLCPVDADGGTYGSLTTRSFGPPLRLAVAEARAVLVELASERLGVPKDQLITQDGYVVNRTDEKVRVSYGSLAGGKPIERYLSPKPVPQHYSQFTVSGKPCIRLDAVEKVTGQAKYTADIRWPGMLYARIVRPPARGARLKSPVDTSAAEQVPGARVLRVGTLIAVLHEQPDMADRAFALIKAEYDLPQTGPDDETVYDHLLSRPPSAQTPAQRGSILSGEQLATSKSEQTYYTAYIAHAPMEPHSAVVSIEGAKVTVWASTQTPFSVKTEVAGTLGISSANVRVITPYVGGGFGGKIVNPQAREAALLARAAGKPVNLAWTREEEFTYDLFQCPSIIKIRSGLDQNKRITFWDYQVYYVGDRGAAMFYDIPNYRTRVYGNSADSRLPFEGGAWRAPGSNANTFARESQMDVLAAIAGVDPLEFRLMHLKNARMRKVLEQAAASFGWPSAKPPSGRGYGVACGEDAGAYLAMMAEVEVDQKTGQIQVKRMLCVQDMGRVINPEGARTQMEGGMIMGLGYALSEELHFKFGRIHDLNFDSYHLPRFSSMPKLETVFIESNATPEGGGEPPIITVGAVLANAVFDAIGVRLSRLPMIPERVLAMIQKSSALTLNSPTRSGSQVQFSWNGKPGVQLQKTTTLTNPIWENVPDTDGKTNVSLPLTDGAAYFRLIKP